MTSNLPSAADLSYFLEVAECQSITRAASRLGISQPSLSASVRRLELGLGASLLIRNHDGCTLTRAGSRLAAESRGLLDAWDRLSQGVVKEESEIRGRYRIGCHPSVALYSLHHVLPRLVRENPEVQISIHNGLSRTVLEDVLRLSVDLGIVVNPARHQELVIRPLCRDEVRFWSAARPSAQQDLLGGDPVVILDPSLFQAQKILQGLQRAGVTTMRTIECGNLETIVELTARGAGLGILPGRVAMHNQAAALKPLGGFEELRVEDSICLVALSDMLRNDAFKRMFRFIELELRAAWGAKTSDGKPAAAPAEAAQNDEVARGERVKAQAASKTSKSMKADKAQSKKLL